MCLLFSKKLNRLRYHALSIFKPRVLFIFKITHIGGELNDEKSHQTSPH